MYAVVGMNTGNTLGLKYLSPTNKIYKSACVYQIEDGDLSPAPYESVSEHYPNWYNLCGYWNEDCRL